MPRSDNVEDRRGKGGAVIGGGLGVLVLIVIAVLFGADPREILQIVSQSEPSSRVSESAPPPADDETAQFVSAILGSTEEVWNDLFAERGAEYREPELVLFDDAVRSACGYQSAATGPFYCPPDQQLYLDLGFFRELARMGGSGDFAAAYVIGHEVGHHVQNLAGKAAEVREAQRRRPDAANELSVRLELQADCYAGVWAARADRERSILEPGDVEEGLDAAAAIGDDRMQRQAGRAVQPESFTHGSSEQRRRWLSRGLETGDPEACDTFTAGAL